MRKNRMMRLASALLILTMVTTCAISGTFAKYVTSDTATDSARVAKWGVGVDVVVEKEGTADGAFGAKYDNAISASGTKVVAANGKDKILAPGTNGTLGTITLSGTPEVMVDITSTADLTLTGWTVGSDVYCPLVFTVTVDSGAATTFQIDTTNTTTALLETAIESAVTTALNADDVAANSDIAKKVVITWEWPFEVGSTDAEIAANDAKDTALGNLTGTDVPEIEFSCSATVTQVDYSL